MHATKETGRLFKKRNSKEVQWGGSLKEGGLYTLYKLCSFMQRSPVQAYRDAYLQVHWYIQDAEGTNYMLLAPT